MIDFESDKTRVDLRELQTFVELRGRDCRVVRWAFAYRRLRNKLWWGVRRRLLSWLKKGPPKDERLHVFWHLRGGLGDCAADRVCVQAWRQKMPNAVFYFFTDTPGAAEILFEADEKHVFLSGKEALWYKYDIAFEVCLSFKTEHINRRRAEQVAPEVLPYLDESLRRQKELGFFVSDNYLTDEVLGRYMYHRGEPQLEVQRYLSGLDFDVCETGLLPLALRDPKTLETYGLQGKKYITIHSGVNEATRLNGRTPLKCWPDEKWREFVHLFKAAHPDILVVQLGGTLSPKFNFADVCLTQKTQLKDLAAILDNSLLHVDGESGLVQLTRWLRTKAVVLFAHTAPECFSLSKNRNIVQTPCGHCMWLVGGQWYTVCLCGHETCRNLDAISPQMVFDAVNEELSK